MVVTGAIGFDEAVAAVDFRTIVLLFSMMIIVAHLRLAGGLAAIGRGRSARASRQPAALLVVLVFAPGVLSALFVNDTICLVFTPLVLDVDAARRLRPLPYLLALATASNIGSAATITGNPQNILIGSVSGIGFARFRRARSDRSRSPAWRSTPRCSAVVFRRELADTAELRQCRRRGRSTRPPVKTLVVAARRGRIPGGLQHRAGRGAGAAALLVTRRSGRARSIAAIDWDLLMLFIGLFGDRRRRRTCRASIAACSSC